MFPAAFRLLAMALLGCPLIALAETVDLSMDWEEGPLYNRNKAYCTIQAAMAPAWTRGYVVIQDGLLVAEGYTNGNNQNGKYEAFSTTKSWSTFLMGALVDQGLISTSDTLLDIFDDESGDWDGVNSAAEKQTITVFELLTMTSGLTPASGIWPCQYNRPQETLQEVLNHADYSANQRGRFRYLPTTHMLAHIILRRTGMTPRDFAASSGIFTKLGITNADFEWTKFGGIEGSAYGLQTNPRIQAKLGQLYLQGGLSAVGDQLVSASWVDESTINQLADGDNTGLTGYGYQWYMDVDGGSGPWEGYSAAVGAQGQLIVILPASNTVVAIMGQGNSGDQQSGIFLQTIVDNLSDLTVEQDTCTEGVSYWNYIPNLRLGSLFWSALQAFPNTLLGRHPV